MMHLSLSGGGVMSAYYQLNPNYPNVFAVLFVLPVSTWRVYVTSYKSQPAQSSAEQSGYRSLSRECANVATG
jgi:hypothetical protein